MTVELDYSTMAPRMLYALVHEIPPEDSYSLQGWPPETRKIAKKAFNQLLNSNPSSRNPNQWHRFAPSLDPDPLPANWYQLNRFQKDSARRQAFTALTERPYDDLLADLLELHTPIEQHFFTGVWGTLQSRDSEIVERVLLNLLDREEPEVVLAIHDSFIVRYGRHEVLLNAMREAFHEVVGHDAVIDEDDTILTPPEGYEGDDLAYAFEVLDVNDERRQSHAGYFARQSAWEQTHGQLNNINLALERMERVDVEGLEIVNVAKASPE